MTATEKLLVVVDVLGVATVCLILRPSKKRVATWCGYQSDFDGRPPVELWTLIEDIPGHPAGSTLSRQTIEAAGLRLPQAPTPSEDAGLNLRRRVKLILAEQMRSRPKGRSGEIPAACALSETHRVPGSRSGRCNDGGN